MRQEVLHAGWYEQLFKRIETLEKEVRKLKVKNRKVYQVSRQRDSQARLKIMQLN